MMMILSLISASVKMVRAMQYTWDFSFWFLLWSGFLLLESLDSNRSWWKFSGLTKCTPLQVKLRELTWVRKGKKVFNPTCFLLKIEKMNLGQKAEKVLTPSASCFWQTPNPLPLPPKLVELFLLLLKISANMCFAFEYLRNCWGWLRTCSTSSLN